MSKEKPNKVKQELTKVTEAIKEIPNIWQNLKHLLEAICLVVVAGFSFWASYQYSFEVDLGAYVLRYSAVVIALRASVEFLKALNKK